MFVNLGRTLFYQKLEPFQREIVLILQLSLSFRGLRIHRGPSVKQKRSWKCSENGGSCKRKQAQGGGCALVAAKSCCANVGSRPMPTVCRKIRQPEVRPLPLVCTKREISGLHSPAAPTLCQKNAQERGRCPSKAASHSQRGFQGLNPTKLRCPPSAPRSGAVRDRFDSMIW